MLGLAERAAARIRHHREAPCADVLAAVETGEGQMGIAFDDASTIYPSGCALVRLDLRSAVDRIHALSAWREPRGRAPTG